MKARRLDHPQCCPSEPLGLTLFVLSDEQIPEEGDFPAIARQRLAARGFPEGTIESLAAALDPVPDQRPFKTAKEMLNVIRSGLSSSRWVFDEPKTAVRENDTEPKPGTGRAATGRSKWWALAAAIVVLGLVGALLIVLNDDDPTNAVAGDTTTTEEPTTTSTTSTSTSTTTSTTTRTTTMTSPPKGVLLSTEAVLTSSVRRCSNSQWRIYRTAELDDSIVISGATWPESYAVEATCDSALWSAGFVLSQKWDRFQVRAGVVDDAPDSGPVEVRLTLEADPSSASGSRPSADPDAPGERAFAAEPCRPLHPGAAPQPS